MRPIRNMAVAAALFVPLAAQATSPIQTCPGIPPASAYTACPAIRCATPQSGDDIVLTKVGDRKVWNRLSTVPPSGAVVGCAAPTPAWTTRGAAGLSEMGPADATPNPPPVGVGDLLTWEPPDNTQATGYRVYVGTSSGSYGPPIDVGASRSWSYSGLPPGTYYFAVSALNASGEGRRSAEVSRTVVAPSVLRCSVSGMDVRCSYGP